MRFYDAAADNTHFGKFSATRLSAEQDNKSLSKERDIHINCVSPFVIARRRYHCIIRAHEN